jgi:hypothetical protein
MTFKKEIEQYLEQIYVLEEAFRKVQDMDTLPLSFFSTSLDVLGKLKTGVHEMESAQLQLMMKHLKESTEKSGNDPLLQVPVSPSDPDLPLTPVMREKEFLGDVIGKKIVADFSKSLTLNERFMFQRDLFHGDMQAMNETFTQLNTFCSLNEAVDYLNKTQRFQWESESGIAFRELLDKRFA